MDASARTRHHPRSRQSGRSGRGVVRPPPGRHHHQLLRAGGRSLAHDGAFVPRVLVREMASEPDRRRAVMRFALAALYIAAGFAHLAVPDKFLAITPSWVPFPVEIILIT